MTDAYAPTFRRCETLAELEEVLVLSPEERALIEAALRDGRKCGVVEMRVGDDLLRVAAIAL